MMSCHFTVSELSERLECRESVNRILIEDKLLTISNTADKIQLCKSGGLDQRETSELTGLSLSTVKDIGGLRMDKIKNGYALDMSKLVNQLRVKAE